MGSYRLTWRPLLEGQIAIGHKPGKKLRALLAETGCTRVVSLLSASESRKQESAYRIRLPLDGADPPGPERTPEVLALFEKMTAELAGGGKLYLHCSAGLHRTGMIAYAYLRHLGFTREQAVAKITELRELTANQLRTPRRRWGEQFARAPAGRVDDAPREDDGLTAG